MTRNKPFFSVIVPAHNSDQYIHKLFLSINEQSFQNFELIVVCDKCSDNTFEVADLFTYKSRGDKVLVTDYGMDGLARNAGIDAADGEWLLFADDDDWFLHPAVFELIAGRVRNTDEDILAFGFLARDFLKPGLQEYYNSGSHIWPAVWNKCYRREFIGDTRFPGIEFTSDLPFTRELFGKGPRTRIWPMPLYYYNYMRKGSQTEIHAREKT